MFPSNCVWPFYFPLWSFLDSCGPVCVLWRQQQRCRTNDGCGRSKGQHHQKLSALTKKEKEVVVVARRRRHYISKREGKSGATADEPVNLMAAREQASKKFDIVYIYSSYSYFLIFQYNLSSHLWQVHDSGETMKFSRVCRQNHPCKLFRRRGKCFVILRFPFDYSSSPLFDSQIDSLSILNHAESPFSPSIDIYTLNDVTEQPVPFGLSLFLRYKKTY